MKKKSTFHNDSRRSGVTLVEFVIYVALTGSVLSLGVGSLINVLLLKSESVIIEEIAYNERFALAVIRSAIQRANSVNSPARGNSSASLSLSMPQAAVNPTVFSLVNGTIMMTEGAQVPVAISTPGVQISNLLFRNVAYSNSTIGSIRITMTISANNLSGRSELDRVKNLSSTFNIRR